MVLGLDLATAVDLILLNANLKQNLLEWHQVASENQELMILAKFDFNNKFYANLWKEYIKFLK